MELMGRRPGSVRGNSLWDWAWGVAINGPYCFKFWGGGVIEQAGCEVMEES